MSRTTPRPRHYVSGWTLRAGTPLLRYSYDRQAYILRLFGDRVGPVLRQDMRRRQLEFNGPDRRGRMVSSSQHVMIGR